MDNAQIIESLRRLKIPHEEIARAINRDRTAATKMLAGKRSVKFSEAADLLRLIQRYENMSQPVDINSTPNNSEHSMSADRISGARIKSEFLRVRYRVQAGVFEAFDNDLDYISPPLPVPQDARFMGAPQWLELVVGDSANLKAPDGTFVHVVDAIGMGYAARTGDWVIAERRRGSTRERTLKQVEVVGNVIRLWPRSTNPKWQAPIDILAGVENPDAVEVEIVGLVIGAYSTF